MAGYAWKVWIRMTPRDGTVETLDLSNIFPGGFSVGGVLAKAEPRYREEQDMRETINRRARPLRFGIRPEIRLRFDIVETSPNHAVLAKIVRRLTDPYWVVAISLDNFNTFRDVYLKEPPTPDPFGDKTVAGARHELRLMCVEPVRDFPDIRTGTSW